MGGLPNPIGDLLDETPLGGLPGGAAPGNIVIPGSEDDPIASVLGINDGGFGKNSNASIPPELLEAAMIFQDIGRQQLALGDPFLESGTADASTILAGGIPDSLRPAVSQGLENKRSAVSESLTENREALTLGGVTGSALQENLAANRASGEAEVARVPETFTLPVLESAFQQVFAAPNQGLASLGGALSAAAGGSIPGRTAGGLGGGVAGAASGALTGFQVGGPYGALAGGVLGGLLGAK